ncbi:MAG: hypothetical protein ABI132_03495 [Rhodanobacteraceae bacterium]
MKTSLVAPPRAAVPGAALLHFYRDVLDKLALWRLTERDEAVLQAVSQVADDLLSSCAKLTRQLQRAGALPATAKIVRLPSSNNSGNNRSAPGFE